MKKFFSIGLATILTLGATQASASCSIGSTTINFGQYNPFSEADNHSSANILINCAQSTQIKVKTASLLNLHQHRYMDNISEQTNDQLVYQLYLDSQREDLFGDGNNNTTYYQGPNKQVTIYGKIPKRQNVYKGIYSGNLLIDLEY